MPGLQDGDEESKEGAEDSNESLAGSRHGPSVLLSGLGGLKKLTS